MNYYNENEAFAAQWLENLEHAGHIAEGVVDDRSILEVRPEDLAPFTQCHFFAGIGGWSHALRLAGWPDDYPVWTGSCPCQPFSQAGSKKGVEDERHLWPAWFQLIDACRPAVIFGEQVASPEAIDWLSGLGKPPGLFGGGTEEAFERLGVHSVFADLERAGYAVGAADFPACSVGAPHRRQRLYFCAIRRARGSAKELEQRPDRDGAGSAGALADATSERRREGSTPHGVAAGSHRSRPADCSIAALTLADSHEDGRRVERAARLHAEGQSGDDAARCGAPGELGDACLDGDREHARELPGDEGEHGVGPAHRDHAPELAGAAGGLPGPVNGFWSDAVWLPCRDGKLRPASPEPEAFPLAARLPGDVGILRAAGNSIVPQEAAIFIQSVMGWVPW